VTTPKNISLDSQTHAGSKEDLSTEPLLREIVRALRGMRYGSIEIVIHEGKATQIERREKLRFDAKS